MATNLARGKAAQAWCKETTRHKEMDADLAEAFAEILDEMLINAARGPESLIPMVKCHGCKAEIPAMGGNRYCPNCGISSRDLSTQEAMQALRLENRGLREDRERLDRRVRELELVVSDLHDTLHRLRTAMANATGGLSKHLKEGI